MQDRRPILLRPLFLAALALLIVNDALLKSRFAGVVTGKLSDFAGLFAFVVFFAAFVPRWRWLVGATTAVAFVWWKSALSQPVVDALHLHRTIDATDLVALVVIPFACWYTREASMERQRVRTAAVATLALAAFVATSKMPGRACCEGSNYEFPNTTREQLVQRVIARGGAVEDAGSYVVLQLPVVLCGERVTVTLENVVERKGTLHVRVDEIRYMCKDDRDDTARQAFEESLGVRRQSRRS